MPRQLDTIKEAHREVIRCGLPPVGCRGRRAAASVTSTPVSTNSVLCRRMPQAPGRPGKRVIGLMLPGRISDPCCSANDRSTGKFDCSSPTSDQRVTRLDQWFGKVDENVEKDLKVSPCLSGGKWGIVRDAGLRTGFPGFFLDRVVLWDLAFKHCYRVDRPR